MALGNRQFQNNRDNSCTFIRTSDAIGTAVNSSVEQ